MGNVAFLGIVITDNLTLKICAWISFVSLVRNGKVFGSIYYYGVLVFRIVLETKRKVKHKKGENLLA